MPKVKAFPIVIELSAREAVEVHRRLGELDSDQRNDVLFEIYLHLDDALGPKPEQKKGL